MAYNRKYTFLCPLCSIAFHPRRLGQIYCCREHGWEFRNQVKALKDENQKKRALQRIKNLHILVKLAIAGEESPSEAFLKQSGFDLKVLKRCYLSIRKEHPEMKFYKLHGFLIQIDPDGYWILPPRHSGNSLVAGEEEEEV